MVRTLKLRHFKQTFQMPRKIDKSQYQNGNEKSITDNAICSKTLSKNIMKVLTDDQEAYKIKGKNKSDHNTYIIDIKKQ